MKKIVVGLLVLLLLAGGGGGAYYYFFMMNEPEKPEVKEETPPLESKAEQIPAKTVVVPNMVYFVIADKLNVRSYPRLNAPIRAVLRKGKKITALEIVDKWVRVSPYQVHESGNDVADWLHTDFLSHDKPVITEKEHRDNMVKLLNKSDDYLSYEDQFILATQSLLEREICRYEDFELTDGWLLSRTFDVEPVYFVYCGGSDLEHKVYLNVTTGEVFQPNP